MERKPHKLTPEIQEYQQILEVLNDEFRSDLAVHLYATYLLRTRNRYLPKRNVTDWPHSIDKVWKPANSADWSSIPGRYTLPSEIKNDPKLPRPTEDVLQRLRPESDPKTELKDALDAIYERTTKQELHPLHKERVLAKLDDTIDKLIALKRQDTSETDHRSLPMNWQAVSSTQNDDLKSTESIRKLFAVALEHRKLPEGASQAAKDLEVTESHVNYRDAVVRSLRRSRQRLKTKQDLLNRPDQSLADYKVRVLTRRERENMEKKKKKGKEP